MCLFPHCFGSHSLSSWGILLALFNTWRLSAFILAQQEVALEGASLTGSEKEIFQICYLQKFEHKYFQKKVSL